MTEPRPVLNENQRRHFAVLLVGLDEALHRIEQLSDIGASVGGPLTTYGDDLPPHFREAVRPLIRELRDQILRLADTLGTGTRDHSRARSVRAMVTSATIRLE